MVVWESLDCENILPRLLFRSRRRAVPVVANIVTVDGVALSYEVLVSSRDVKVVIVSRKRIAMVRNGFIGETIVPSRIRKEVPNIGAVVVAENGPVRDIVIHTVPLVRDFGMTSCINNRGLQGTFCFVTITGRIVTMVTG